MLDGFWWFWVLQTTEGRRTPVPWHYLYWQSQSEWNIYHIDLPHFVSVTTQSINITKSSSRLHSATAQIQNDPDRLVGGRMASSMVASCSLLSKRTPRAIGFKCRNDSGPVPLDYISCNHDIRYNKWWVGFVLFALCVLFFSCGWWNACVSSRYNLTQIIRLGKLYISNDPGCNNHLGRGSTISVSQSLYVHWCRLFPNHFNTPSHNHINLIIFTWMFSSCVFTMPLISFLINPSHFFLTSVFVSCFCFFYRRR